MLYKSKTMGIYTTNAIDACKIARSILESEGKKNIQIGSAIPAKLEGDFGYKINVSYMEKDIHEQLNDAKEKLENGLQEIQNFVPVTDEEIKFIRNKTYFKFNAIIIAKVNELLSDDDVRDIINKTFEDFEHFKSLIYLYKNSKINFKLTTSSYIDDLYSSISPADEIVEIFMKSEELTLKIHDYLKNRDIDYDYIEKLEDNLRKVKEDVIFKNISNIEALERIDGYLESMEVKCKEKKAPYVKKS